MIVVEGKFGSCGCNLLAVFHELFHTTHLGEGGSHRTDTPCTDFGSVACEFLGFAERAAAHMDDDLEVFGHSLHPSFGQTLAFVGGEHIAFAARTVDKHAFKAVFLQHRSIGGDGLQIDVAVGEHRGEWSVDKSFDFFHINEYYMGEYSIYLNYRF